MPPVPASNLMKTYCCLVVFGGSRRNSNKISRNLEWIVMHKMSFCFLVRSDAIQPRMKVCYITLRFLEDSTENFDTPILKCVELLANITIRVRIKTMGIW